MLILAAGAIASAFAPNYTFLLISRIVLGIGIGGDYPVSATIMSEYSGKQSRGRMAGLVFAMQGLLVGPLIASVLLGSGVSNNLTWSIQILGFGMMALMFLIVGFVPVIAKHALPFLLLYGISYFFTEFGPNTTTFIYPAGLFPPDVRTTGHGIAAGCGKLGAFAGAFLFPDFLAVTLGLNRAMVIAGSRRPPACCLPLRRSPNPWGKPWSSWRRKRTHRCPQGSARSRAWLTDIPEPAAASAQLTFSRR
ncbi:MAG TPA: MFS transporter [Streptosporangiaceae bacterium]|nr:MFS transporter [Streptosporangiaceae bacterium]